MQPSTLWLLCALTQVTALAISTTLVLRFAARQP